MLHWHAHCASVAGLRGEASLQWCADVVQAIEALLKSAQAEGLSPTMSGYTCLIKA